MSCSTPKPPPEFVRRLTQARQKAGLSARELSIRTGGSNKLVRMIETGVTTNPTIGVTAALAGALGVSLDWLILGKGRRTCRARPREKRAKETPHLAPPAEAT